MTPSDESYRLFLDRIDVPVSDLDRYEPEADDDEVEVTLEDLILRDDPEDEE